MKKFLILSAFVMFALAQAIAAKHTVTASGMSFLSDEIYAYPGDTVVFDIGSSHNAVEVSESTWDANGATSNGGFSLPFGGGMIVMSAPGTYYYVCTSHVSLGMKGKIEVMSVSGFDEGTASRDEIVVYPNPVKDDMTVEFRDCNFETGLVEIYDVTGTLQFQLDRSMLPEKCIIQFDLRPLPAGLYLAVFRHSDKKQVKHFKFIKQ